MGHLLTVVARQLFQCCNNSSAVWDVLCIFLMTTTMAPAMTPMSMTPALDFDRKSPHHTVFSHLPVSYPLWLVTTLRTVGSGFCLGHRMWFLSGEVFSWTGWMPCVLVWSPRVWPSTLITGMGHAYLQVPGEICFPKQREYSVAFEHFLVLCCSFGVCKLHITGNQNLFSLWLTIV